jgi:flagellar hook-length control protein FliK
MALASANAVSPTPAVESAAMAGAALVTGKGDATGGAFIDSLQAVLGVQGIASGKSTTVGSDLPSALLAQGTLAKLKSKLKTDVAANDMLAINPLAAQQQATQQQLATPQTATAQQAAQQQAAIIGKLENTQTGIDMPALRAAMGKGSQLSGRARTMPVTNPADDVSAAVASADATTANGPVTTAAANAQTAVEDATAASSNAAGTDTQNADAGSSKAAADTTTQQKLVAALAKTAQAPVLKGTATDGSQVPNTKIGHRTRAQKQDSETSADNVFQMAAKIAATAGITNTPDTASTAAQAIAVAEVAAKNTATAPTVAKIEAAAMANATQTATHTPAPQAKVEAQALPVQFDAQSANPDGKDSSTQSDIDGKDKDQSGSARTASDSAKSTPSQTFADSQQPAPAATPTAPSVQPTQTTSADMSANANLAGTANTSTAAPTTTAQVAVNLQVAPQTLQNMTPDQASFAALGVSIATKTKDGERQFDIKMDPAELGKVDVRISVDATGKAQAHLAVQHPQTLQLLQNDKGTLERSLRDAGLNLSNNGLNFSLQGEQQSSTPTFTARNRALSISAVQAVDPISTSSSASLVSSDSRLDIRV